MHFKGRGDGIRGLLRLRGPIAIAAARKQGQLRPLVSPTGASRAFSFPALSAPITNVSPASTGI